MNLGIFESPSVRIGPCFSFWVCPAVPRGRKHAVAVQNPRRRPAETSIRGRHGVEKRSRGVENLTSEAPPKKGFWTPAHAVRFPPPSGVSALFFLYRNPRQSRPEVFWRGPKIFGRARCLVRFPPPIRFAPPPYHGPTLRTLVRGNILGELRGGLFGHEKRDPKPKLLSPVIFWWGEGLPREGVGAKKFGMSLETRETKLFWRDIPGFCWDIPGAPEKFENKSLCSILDP